VANAVTGPVAPLAFRANDDDLFAGVPLVNRFTIDDLRAGWSAPDAGHSRRGRRLGGLSNYRTDPYER
jgi:hypothetical protein